MPKKTQKKDKPQKRVDKRVKDLGTSQENAEGVRGGKVAMQDFSFTSKVDKSSPS